MLDATDLGTYIIRGIPPIENLNIVTEGYKKVVIFSDFNNLIKGAYYPEVTETIVTYIINNDFKIPSILISEWMKFEQYLEMWAKVSNKDLSTVYFSEHGVSFYHKNLYKDYKVNRDGHRNITIPTGLVTYFDNDITKVNEMISNFMNSSWEWIRDLSLKGNVATFRLSNLDADFIPEYLFRKVKDFFQEDTCYIILSSDGDMIQLLDFGPNVKILDGPKIITENDWMTSKKYLQKDLGDIKDFIRADRILLYKATVGDSSDCIPGVPKVGGKSFAKDLINIIPEEINCDDIPTLKKFFNNDAPKNKSVEKILENWDKFELGLKLTSFRILIEYLYATPTRNDMLIKMLNENEVPLSSNAALSNIMIDNAPINLVS